MKIWQSISEGPFSTLLFLLSKAGFHLKWGWWVGSGSLLAVTIPAPRHLGGKSAKCRGMVEQKGRQRYGMVHTPPVLPWAVYFPCPYGSFPSLTSKALMLMVFSCFFSSSPLILGSSMLQLQIKYIHEDKFH